MSNHLLYMAFSGMNSRTRALEVSANNVANANTVGFKRDKVVFDLVMELASEDELERSINAPLVRARTKVDFTPGSLIHTGNPLHLALANEGFFMVQTPEGVRYTRNGEFSRNQRGELVTKSGHPVLDNQGRPILLPEGEIQVAINGEISAGGVVAGQLGVVDFQDLGQLRKVGATLFAAPDTLQSLPPASLAVSQGFLEEANVNPVLGLAEMVSIMRSFELLSQAVRAVNEAVDRRIVNDIPQL